MASYEDFRDMFEKREDLRRQVQEIIEKLEPWKEFDAKLNSGMIPADAQLLYGKVGPLETQPGIGGWECLFIKHGEGYDLIQNQPCYEAIIAHGDWVILEEYFALQRKERRYTLIPLTMQTIAPTFGELAPVEQRILDRGDYRIRRELYLPSDKQPVQLEMVFGNEDPLSFVDQRLRNLHDPLVLKLLYITLHLCQRNNANYFYYYPNKIADLMGYSRYARGKGEYHQTGNIKRIERKISTLLDAIYHWEMPWGDKTLSFTGPLLEIGKTTVELRQRGKLIAKGDVVYFHPRLYEEITTHRRFAWIDNKCLLLNVWEHGKAFLLYSYYSNQISLGVREHGRKIRQRLRTILTRSGISIGSHRTRDLQIIRREHDFLVSEGFVSDWQIVRKSKQPLDSIWEITMPGDHPAWLHWEDKLQIPE